MVDKVANVFRTDNYSLFKNLDGNRDVVEMRVARVVESIQNNFKGGDEWQTFDSSFDVICYEMGLLSFLEAK